MPQVSVIIPCYNHAHYLPHAVRSVLAQQFDDWEVIIVDDGSTDNTRAVIRRFTDARIKYVYRLNGGLPAARNTGIRQAEGQYMAFLDADDQWDHDFMAVMVEALNRHTEASFVYCGTRFMDEEGVRLPRIAPPGLPPHDHYVTLAEVRSFLTHSVLCRRKDIVAAGLFDESLTSCEDWDLWIRLIQRLGPPVAVERLLAWYRLSANAMSTNTERMLVNMKRVIEKHLETGSQLRDYANATAHFVAAIDYLMKGDEAAVISHLRQAHHIDPTFINRQGLYYELICGQQSKGSRGIIAELDLPANLEVASRLLRCSLIPGCTAAPESATAIANGNLLLTGAHMAWLQGNHQLLRQLVVKVVLTRPSILGRSRTWRLILKAAVGRWLPRRRTLTTSKEGNS